MKMNNFVTYILNFGGHFELCNPIRLKCKINNVPTSGIIHNAKKYLHTKFHACNMKMNNFVTYILNFGGHFELCNPIRLKCKINNVPTSGIIHNAKKYLHTKFHACYMKMHNFVTYIFSYMYLFIACQVELS